MTYKFNNRNISIPDKEIESLMKSLELSKDEAIDLWLCDHDYDEDEEQTELQEKAKDVKILHEATSKSEKKPRKPPEKKVSDEKKELFSEIYGHLDEIFGEDVEILTENKLISVKIGDKTFKIDVIQTRTPSLDNFEQRKSKN